MLPMKTVVKITRDSVVVTMISLFLNIFPSILRTRPKAMAPRIMPANQMKICYLNDKPLSYLQSFSKTSNPQTAMNRPIIITKISTMIRVGHHLRSPKLKNEIPR